MSDDARSLDTQSPPKPPMRGFLWFAAILLGASIAILPADAFLSNPNNLEYLPGDLTRIVGLSEIFAHGFGVVLIAFGIWFLAKQHSRFIPRIAMCACWPAFGVLALKSLFSRYRPIYYFDEDSNFSTPASMLDTWKGWMPNDSLNMIYGLQSFPSAHAATTWGLAIGMAWAFPKGRWLFFGVAVLASIQRVTSFAHWSSDVLVGASIAFVMAGAITQNWGLGYWFGRFENRNNVELLLAEDEIEIRRAA